MRGIVGIQSRREIPQKPPRVGVAVYFGGIIKGTEGQVDFGCYDTLIQTHIVPGANLDIEWTEKPGQEYQGLPTTQRTVNQLYIDGKPVVEKQQGKGFGGGGYKDSPESRASAEAQTAVNDVVSLLVAKVITLDHSLAQKAIAWLDSKLPMAGKPAAPPTEKPAPKATPESAHPQPPSDNVTEFWRAAKEQGYNPATESGLAALKTWMVSHGTSLKFQELSDEKQKELIAAMRQSKMPFSK